MASEEQYICAVSGVAAEPAEDGEMPPGWAEVSILVRTENQAWGEIQAAKDAIVEQHLASLPEDKREAVRAGVVLQVRAQFAALEAVTPRYLVEEREVHVAAEHLGSLLELLGENDG